MQILGRESAEFVDFDGEMRKNHLFCTQIKKICQIISRQINETM